MNATAKFTPGPWEVRRYERDGELHDVFVQAPDVNGYAYRAEILGEDEYREQSGGIARKLADASLIAAAPDMYEALEGLLKSHKPGIGQCCAEADAAIAAIAKAEGRT